MCYVCTHKIRRLIVYVRAHMTSYLIIKKSSYKCYNMYWYIYIYIWTYVMDHRIERKTQYHNWCASCFVSQKELCSCPSWPAHSPVSCQRLISYPSSSRTCGQQQRSQSQIPTQCTPSWPGGCSSRALARCAWPAWSIHFLPHAHMAHTWTCQVQELAQSWTNRHSHTVGSHLALSQLSGTIQSVPSSSSPSTDYHAQSSQEGLSFCPMDGSWDCGRRAVHNAPPQHHPSTGGNHTADVSAYSRMTREQGGQSFGYSQPLASATSQSLAAIGSSIHSTSRQKRARLRIGHIRSRCGARWLPDLSKHDQSVTASQNWLYHKLEPSKNVHFHQFRKPPACTNPCVACVSRWPNLLTIVSKAISAFTPAANQCAATRAGSTWPLILQESANMT